MGEWTLFSNHGHVLVCLARNNQARLRDVAADVGITERAVQNILRELQDAGLVAISKHGRCNHYQINSRKSLRHHLESGCTVGKLMQLINQDEPSVAQAESGAEAQKPKPTKPGISKPSKTEPVSIPDPAGDRIRSGIPDKPKAATPDNSPKVAAASDAGKVVSEVRTPSHVVKEKQAVEEKTPAVVASPPKPKAKSSADKKPENKKSDAGKPKDKPPSSQQGSLF